MTLFANLMVLVRLVLCWPLYTALQDRRWFTAGLIALGLIISDLFDGQSFVPKRYGVKTKGGERGDVYVDRIALFTGLFGVFASGTVVQWSSQKVWVGLLLVVVSASVVMADQSQSARKGNYVAVVWTIAYAVVGLTILTHLSGSHLAICLIGAVAVYVVMTKAENAHVEWARHGGPLRA